MLTANAISVPLIYKHDNLGKIDENHPTWIESVKKTDKDL